MEKITLKGQNPKPKYKALSKTLLKNLHQISQKIFYQLSKTRLKITFK